MTDATPEMPRPKSIEFFKVETHTPPPPDPADPYPNAQMIYANDDDQRVFEAAAPAMLANEKIGFVMFPEMPLNMVVTEFGPNYLLPQHSHAEDCMYYIESGEVIMGARRMGPGEGFLVRANQPYAYSSGPDGVRVLEIRHQPMNPPNFTLRDKNVAGWSEKFFAAIGEEAPTPA